MTTFQVGDLIRLTRKICGLPPGQQGNITGFRLPGQGPQGYDVLFIGDDKSLFVYEDEMELIDRTTVFAHMAELEILGWKFRVRGDGTLEIETSVFNTPDPQSQALMALNSAHRELLAALLALPGSAPVEGAFANRRVSGLGYPS